MVPRERAADTHILFLKDVSPRRESVLTNDVRSFYLITLNHFSAGAETIVGVNKHRLNKEENVDVLSIDNTAVRRNQA